MSGHQDGYCVQCGEAPCELTTELAAAYDRGLETGKHIGAGERLDSDWQVIKERDAEYDHGLEDAAETGSKAAWMHFHFGSEQSALKSSHVCTRTDWGYADAVSKAIRALKTQVKS